MPGMRAMRWACATLTTLALVSGCSSGPENEFEADVLEVRAPDQLVVAADDGEKDVRLAGIVVPKPNWCLHDEALEATLQRLDGETSLNFRVLGQDDEKTDMVTVRLPVGGDLATELVAEGLAIPDAEEADVADAMLEARARAKTLQLGLFDPTVDCTLAARHARATGQLSRALNQDQPTNSDAAAAEVAALVAAIAVAKATEAFISRSMQSMQVLAYSAAEVSQMVGRLARMKRRAVREMRRLKKVEHRMIRAERAELARKRAEAQRRREERARQAAEAARLEAERQQREAEQRWLEQQQSSSDDDSSSSSSSSGGSYWPSGVDPGYTGPRCYEPGGVVWSPC